jgi:DNA-binding NarL/FixJ family response regulator
VILVDPLPVVREGIAMLIGTHPGLEVVLEPRTGSQALAQLAKLRRRGPLVALITVAPDTSDEALWLIHQIREAFPLVRIVASGSAADQMSISRALFAGADGFVDRLASPEEFLQALADAPNRRMVLAGVPPNWLGPIADGVEQQELSSVLLTNRELEVLSVAAEGLRAREIAERLGVSARTVTTHLARIYAKLGVNSRVGAITTAARSGLVSLRGAPALLEREAG